MQAQQQRPHNTDSLAFLYKHSLTTRFISH